MHEIEVNNIHLPQIIETGFYSAYEPFFHMKRKADFHVLILVVEGSIYVTEDEIDYEIKPREMFFLKASVLHYGKVQIPKGTRWYYIHFKLIQFQNQKMGMTEIENVKKIKLPKKIKFAEKSKYENFVSQIVKDFHSIDEEKLWLINMKLFEFFYEVFSLTNTAFVGEFRKAEKLSDKICIFLEENCDKKFSAKKLEEKFCLSYKRLAAIFKEEKQESMQTFHTRCKIKKACNLLKTTTYSINEIAEKMGFEDQLYFSRVFKSQIGDSPSQWRKKILY